MTIRRNIVSNWAGMFAIGAISFLLAPLMIHRLGATFYGLWILASSLVDYSGLLDTGMRTALFRYSARYLGRNDRTALNGLLASALALALGCSLLLLILSPAVWWLPRWFPHAGVDAGTLRATVFLLGLSLVFTFPARALGSYLSGIRRFDLYNLGAVAGNAVRALLIAVLLLRGFGVIAVAVAALAAAMFSLAFNYGLVRAADPAAMVHWRRANWRESYSLFRYGIYAFLNLCGESLRSYTDAIVITRVLTLALVTPFSIATRLIGYARMTLSAAGSPLMGRMSELDGSGEHRQLQTHFLQCTRCFALASVGLTLGLLLDGRAFITLWIGPEYAGSAHLLNVLALGYLAAFAQLPAQLVVFAMARHRFTAWLTVIEGSGNLALSIVWAHRYGLVGVAWGTTVPLLATMLVAQPWYVLRVTGIPLRRYLRQSLAGPAAVGAAGWLLLGRIGAPAASWLHLGAAAAVQGLVLLLLAAVLATDAGERRRLAHAFTASFSLLRATFSRATELNP